MLKQLQQPDLSCAARALLRVFHSQEIDHELMFKPRPLMSLFPGRIVFVVRGIDFRDGFIMNYVSSVGLLKPFCARAQRATLTVMKFLPLVRRTIAARPPRARLRPRSPRARTRRLPTTACARRPAIAIVTATAAQTPRYRLAACSYCSRLLGRALQKELRFISLTAHALLCCDRQRVCDGCPPPPHGLFGRLLRRCKLNNLNLRRRLSSAGDCRTRGSVSDTDSIQLIGSSQILSQRQPILRCTVRVPRGSTVHYHRETAARPPGNRNSRKATDG
jgi:hypothetical protein